MTTARHADPAGTCPIELSCTDPNHRRPLVTIETPLYPLSEFTPEEAAKLAEFDAAPTPPEVLREQVAQREADTIADTVLALADDLLERYEDFLDVDVIYDWLVAEAAKIRQQAHLSPEAMTADEVMREMGLRRVDPGFGPR